MISFSRIRTCAVRFALSIGSLLMLSVFSSCDDNTGTLSVDMMPQSDFLTRSYDVYDVKTKSYAVGDSVLARSSVSYLGRFSDPETGTMINCDFLGQFLCPESFKFPDSIQYNKITSGEIRLNVSDFVGDSLASFGLEVYELDSVLDPTLDYYTNINPEDYYDTSKEPVTTKWFTLSDRTIDDSERNSTSYKRTIRISLPTDSVQKIYDAYREHPELFANTEAWMHSGLPYSKGFYYKIVSGDGAIAYIDVAVFNMRFNYYDTEEETDTTGVCQLPSNEEVVQATRFSNEGLNTLLEDENATYLKSPAGIFTLAELPTDDIVFADTINSAKLTFVRYNDEKQSLLKLGIPQNVLLVRLDDYLQGFFEKYKLADDVTSYLTTFNSSTNSYVFSNIAKLISTIRKEKMDGTATENVNKVLLIPVEVNEDSSGDAVKISHDFSLASTKLVGGANDTVKLKVIHTSYK